MEQKPDHEPAKLVAFTGSGNAAYSGQSIADRMVEGFVRWHRAKTPSNDLHVMKLIN